MENAFMAFNRNSRHVDSETSDPCDLLKRVLILHPSSHCLLLLGFRVLDICFCLLAKVCARMLGKCNLYSVFLKCARSTNFFDSHPGYYNFPISSYLCPSEGDNCRRSV